MANKCTKIEKEKRIQDVQELIIEGVQDYLILRRVTTKWSITTRQAKKYLNLAYSSWKQDADVTIELRRQAKIAELKEELRSLRCEYKGTPAGLNARTRLHKLLIRLEGLDPPMKHQVEAKLTQTDDMSREERDKKIEQLIAKHNSGKNLKMG